MKRYFCTYFDSNFSARGLALYKSLCKNSTNFTLIVLALDDGVAQQLNRYEHIQILNIHDYLDRFNIDTSKYRTRKELYFSLTAGYCLFVMEQFPEIDILFYLDADIFFYNSVEYLFEEMGDSSIYITSHNVMPLLKKFMGYYGSYNVGINGFRNDPIGLKCIRKWKEDCDSWNSNGTDQSGSFFSDQIYLDKWPIDYQAVCISDNPGINLAPWSIGQYQLNLKNGNFYIEERPVIAFHFSDIKRLSQGKWETNSGPHLFFMMSNKKELYRIYLEIVEKCLSEHVADPYVSLNHGRSSLRSRVRQMFNILTSSIVKV